MSPAVIVAMPQYTNATASAANGNGNNSNSSGNNNSSSANSANDFSYGKDGGGNSADSWNMDLALDFDLLAAYLLEDMGGGGFDFSPEGMTPPLQQQRDAWEGSQDASVITPGSASTARYIEPPPQQQQQQRQTRAAWVGVGGGDLPLDTQKPIPAVLQQPMGGRILHHQHQRPPQSQQAVHQQVQQQPRPSIPTFAPRAPVAEPIRAPILASSTMMQSNKRPRIVSSPAPSISTTASAKGPMTSHSFTLASASAASASSTFYQPGGGMGIGGAVAAEAGGGVGLGGSDRQKSQAQQDRRRERNRILARRTRLRKKFFFESLQKDVSDLQRENAALKSIVRSRLPPEDAQPLLERCNANELLPSAIHNLDDGDFDDDEVGVGGGGYAKMLDREDFSLIQSIQNSQQCFVITDPSLHDNPIVYASDDFLSLTGYTQEEVLGRNCRFLQGTETNPNKVAMIRKAVEVGEDVTVTLVNYTSEGVPFWNSLFIAALRDAEDNIVNFIGVIVRVNGPEPGDAEYGKVLV